MRKEGQGFPKEVRHYIKEKQENRCLLCGWFGNLSIHHCKPLSRGGENSPKNAVGLCRNHNNPDCPNCHDIVDHLTLDCGIPFETILEEGVDYLLQMNPMKK